MTHTALYVLRTSKDKDTGELVVETQRIPVVDVGDSYFRPDKDHAQAWEWAFGKATKVLKKSSKVGYTRYYDTSLRRLHERFLESRRQAVRTARKTLDNAEKTLQQAEHYLLLTEEKNG